MSAGPVYRPMSDWLPQLNETLADRPILVGVGIGSAVLSAVCSG